MPVLFNDYDFGKARQEEIRREAEATRRLTMFKAEQPSKPGIRDRVLISFGNILITAGWKIRSASACAYPCPDPTRG
jgi:hypothetical protein